MSELALSTRGRSRRIRHNSPCQLVQLRSLRHLQNSCVQQVGGDGGGGLAQGRRRGADGGPPASCGMESRRWHAGEQLVEQSASLLTVPLSWLLMQAREWKAPDGAVHVSTSQGQRSVSS